jgi:PAS domain S-box-containing protein
MEKKGVDRAKRILFERPFEIVLVYFVVSAFWIFLSDNIVYIMVEDPSMRYNISVVKGLAFIIMTSILLYYLVKKGFDSLRSSQASFRKSERRIRVMIERAPFGIIESDENGFITRANLKANDILGTSSVELIGSNLKDFVVRSTDIIPEQGTVAASRDGVARFSRKNGKPIWVQRISTPISDETDSERYVLEMIQDVTEQKESSMQLARRAEELEALYDVSRKIIGSELAADSLENICGVAVDRLQASSASVYVLDASGGFVKIAQKGAPPDAGLETMLDTEGQGPVTMVHGDRTWAVVPLHEGSSVIGAMVFGHDDPEWFTKDRIGPFQSLANLSLLSIQKVRMIETLKQYANDLEDKVTERTRDLMEVTERLEEEVKRTKEAQERLFQEKERLDVTIRSIGEGVIVTGIDGTILLANQIAEDKCAMTDSVVGLNTSSALPILDPVTEEVVASYWAGRDHDPISEKKGILFGLSGRRDLSYNSAPVKDRSGQVIGYVIVFRDITEDVRLQRAVSEAQRLESIGQLAGGIAHSFNNILTSILGNVEMLSYVQMGELRRNACLGDVREAAMKAKDLSNQLLTFARGGEPIRKGVSLLGLLRGIAERYSDGSRVDVHVSSENEQYIVNADEVQIGQAFTNLISNALASAPCGIVLEISLAHQDIENGRGSSAAATRYVAVNLKAPTWISQRSEKDSSQAQGSAMDEKQGLDLAIANSIIRRHDGFMVMDTSTKGSNYKVYLLAWSECINAPQLRSKHRLDRPARVLIMDDDENVLEVLSRMIEVLGHQVVAAKEGGEAIDLYAKADAAGEPFDVVIMDLNIPGGLGGRETIRRLQEGYEGVNAIVSSGYSNDPITANYISYGFKGVLPKPYTMRQLEDAIQKALVAL